MARLPRIVVPGQPLHLVQRGNNRQAVFFADEDYRRYLEDLREAAPSSGCAIHAYVLMTNHVHILLTPATTQSPSNLMQALGRRYVRYVNGAYRRSGTLWEGRYKSALIDTEHYLLTCYRYIELNPVRAGLVTTPGDYRWSSYRATALGQKDEILTSHALYLRLGATDGVRHTAYRELFRSHIEDAAIRELRVATELGHIAGSERFKEQIETMLSRRINRLPHGGDRKSERYRKQREQAGSQHVQQL